jgi:hypothetical protein
MIANNPYMFIAEGSAQRNLSSKGEPRKSDPYSRVDLKGMIIIRKMTALSRCYRWQLTDICHAALVATNTRTPCDSMKGVGPAVGWFIVVAASRIFTDLGIREALMMERVAASITNTSVTISAAMGIPHVPGG